MEAEVLVRDVKHAETRSGHTRWTLIDDAGKEYTTFRPRIGEEAQRHTGSRARIKFHEEERNGFHNVYLDAVEPVAQAAGQPTGGGDGGGGGGGGGGTARGGGGGGGRGGGGGGCGGRRSRARRSRRTSSTRS